MASYSTASANALSASSSSSVSVSGTGSVHSSGRLSTSVDAVEQQAQATATISSRSNQESTTQSAIATAYVDQTGAGGSSSAIAVSPSGETSLSEDSVFTPGATSSQSNASAATTPEGTTTSATVVAPATGTNPEKEESTPLDNSADNADTLIYQIGLNTLFNAPFYQDLMIGSEGANTFGVSATGVDSIQEADIIAQFNLAEDSLQLMDGLTIHDIEFLAIDLNGDSIHESTVIRHVQDETVLAVALNALFTTAIAPEEVTLLNNPAPETDESIASYTLDYLIGSSSQDTLISDAGQDILFGGEEADIFALETTSLSDLNTADILVDFNVEEGDRIHLLNTDISLLNDLVLETIDLDNNGFIDSTLIRLETGGILAIAQGTVDALGNTLLSTDVFSLAPGIVEPYY